MKAKTVDFSIYMTIELISELQWGRTRLHQCCRAHISVSIEGTLSATAACLSSSETCRLLKLGLFTLQKYVCMLRTPRGTVF